MWNFPSKKITYTKEMQIVWFHNRVFSAESLEIALSSGLVTHVMLWGGYHNETGIDHESVQRALPIIEKYRCKFIWCRTLWPIHFTDGFKASEMWRQSYYRLQVQQIDAEKEALGADFTAFDFEPYCVNNKEIFEQYLRGTTKLTPEQREEIRIACQDVYPGTVDYVTPIYKHNEFPYDLMAHLGKDKVGALNTYDEPNVWWAKYYPYNIAGYFVASKPDDLFRTGGKPPYPFFTVSAMFEKENYFSRKDGLCIFPLENKVLEVAQALFDYAKGKK